MSFFDEFKHIVPYSIKVNVGKNTKFKTDKTKTSYLNHKGKMVEHYRKPSTIKELEEHGPNTFMEYVPAENVSLPIDIQVSSEEKLTPFFEKTSKYTNKKQTHHEIRMFNSDKTQVGYASLTLTPSGDIREKTNFYHSEDGNETIMHITYNNMVLTKVIKDDIFEFEKKSEEGNKKIRICQREGKVIACSVIEEDLKTREEIMFQSITHSKNEKTPKLKKYVSSCVQDETDYVKRGGTLIPWECKTLEEDLTSYLEEEQSFQRYAKWIEEESGTKITIDSAIKIRQLPDEVLENLRLSDHRFNLGYLSSMAQYLKNENNNRLKDFKGNYIGNILKLTDSGYEACIVTKQQKDGQDYRLYTLIDFSGTSITQGTGLEEYEGIGRDQNYFKRLEESDKTPKFVTKIGKDGKEELVLYVGKAISGECPEYTQFVEDFIEPLSEVRPVKINEFLNRENGQNR